MSPATLSSNVGGEAAATIPIGFSTDPPVTSNSSSASPSASASALTSLLFVPFVDGAYSSASVSSASRVASSSKSALSTLYNRREIGFCDWGEERDAGRRRRDGGHPEARCRPRDPALAKSRSDAPPRRVSEQSRTLHFTTTSTVDSFPDSAHPQASCKIASTPSVNALPG